MRFTLSWLCIALCMLLGWSLRATQLVNGPATTDNSLFTFDTAVVAKAYDRGSGTLYCGIDGGGLYRAPRPIGNSGPKFNQLTIVSGTIALNLLTLVTYTGNKYPYLGFVKSGALAEVSATNSNGSATGQPSGILKDAAGAGLQTTDSIRSLAGMLKFPTSVDLTGTYTTLNQGFVFAAVPPANGVFGGLNSGIAVVCMKALDTNITLNQSAADAADPMTIKAKRLDVTTPEIGVAGTQPNLIQNFATMCWDDYFQRLYIGLELISGSAPNDGAKSVVVARVQGCGVLTFDSIVRDSAISTSIPPGEEIVVAKTSGGANDIFAVYLRVMHCGTGPSYLIVNGGTNPTLSSIYALPLVDTPQIPTQHGTLAKKNSALRDYRFVDPAIAPGDLAIDIDDFAQVGAGSLPIQPSTPISDIEVIGDTVFVSTCTGNGPTDNNGIFYSQALFDSSGKIVRWTPWAKKAWPYNTFCDTSCTNLGIKYFAVDAVTGKVWAVDCATGRVVQVTAWDKGAPCGAPVLNCAPATTPCCTRGCGGCCGCGPGCNLQFISTPTCNNLVARLNSTLFDGCYSALDLDQGTNGFIGLLGTFNRFALFGGMGKVVFARTSVAYLASLSSPQDVMIDFGIPENFLETKLTTTTLNQTKCIKILEYSRCPSSLQQAYFFAGTDQGLFAYAKRIGMAGFNVVNELDLLTLAAQGQWFDIGTDLNIPEFNESIIDIKSTGLAVFTVTRSVVNGAMVSTLYASPLQTDLATMFATRYIVAQTGAAPFDSAFAFTGIQPVQGNTRLLLATNNGLFVSVDGADINDATNQAQAGWTHVPQFNRTMFEGIAAPDSAHPSTTWPISVEDQCGWQTYERSSIYQMSVAPSTPPVPAPTFIPNPFNSNSQLPQFQTLDPITYFWSDGARRFFIINRAQDPQTVNKLMTFPYNTAEWNVCGPEGQVLIFDPYVAATNRFFWVKQIGYTGILMAGTDTGVIALE